MSSASSVEGGETSGAPPVAGPSGLQTASTSKGLFTSPKKAFMMREAANRESGEGTR